VFPWRDRRLLIKILAVQPVPGSQGCLKHVQALAIDVVVRRLVRAEPVLDHAAAQPQAQHCHLGIDRCAVIVSDISDGRWLMIMQLTPYFLPSFAILSTVFLAAWDFPCVDR